MPTPAPTKTEMQRRIAAVNAALKAGHPRKGVTNQPSAVSVAADALHMPRESLRQSMMLAETKYGIAPDWSLEKKPAPVGNIQAVDNRRQQDLIASLRKQVRDMERELAQRQDLRRELFGLSEQSIEPPSWTIKPCAPGAPGMPMLFTSDFQWGEVIRPGELDGVNAFNVKIAQARYKLLIEKTVDLALAHMGKPKYPGIIYLRGGDAVSGDIHEELRETNELSSIPAVKSLVEAEAAGIETLAGKFGYVRVVSVPGNHGRATMKPRGKRAFEANYDTMSAWMLEREFKSDKRVTFLTPESGDAIFSVYGWKYLLTHGDKIGSRGGEGFIGPAATIARGMKKLIDYYASFGQTIDTIFVGHFHQSMELPWGFCNGSLPGYSEYAKMHRMKPEPSKQWLLFSHPKYGLTARWPILLSERMKRDVPVNDLAVRAA
jgi:hypothetical protein